MMRFLPLFFLTAFLLLPHSWAQAQEGEAKSGTELLETLRNYTPPPMFGHEDEAGQPAAPEALPLELFDVQITPSRPRDPRPPQAPVPVRKPKKAMIPIVPGEMEDDSLQSNLRNPSVQDILQQIEGKKGREEEAQPGPSTRISIPFARNRAALPASLNPEFVKAIQARLQKNPGSRVVIEVHASGGAAKDLVRARGMVVRSFLVENGVEAGLIDLEPSGHTTGGASPDRADVIF
ncbi:MAG: hypothetical protein K9G62_07835 [Alphaproteobacteria bacterium]|nr:hypothetical protein [Alphaproteobacteria bacterium]